MDEIIIHAIKDTLPIVPILLIVHILIEIFEVHKLGKLRASGVLGGGFAPLIGTAVGLLPQCGFSIIASEMYAKKYITVGTLVAVFIATSDEALPILLGGAMTDAGLWGKFGALIGIKVIMALLAGYTVNLLLHKHKRREIVAVQGEVASGAAEKASSHAEAEHSAHEEHAHDAAADEIVVHGCCGHTLEHDDESGESGESKEQTGWQKFKRFFGTYLKHPLIHTAIITLFIFIINAVVGGIIHGLGGEDKLSAIMQQGVWLQPLISVAVGLIPNCAASVVITQLYMQNMLTLGATVAGLAVNAGLGFAVLFKANKNLRNNFLILIGLIVYALAAGYLITAIV